MAETGVCIKIIDRSKSNNVNLDIIYREVQIHTPLSHLNIVNLYNLKDTSYNNRKLAKRYKIANDDGALETRSCIISSMIFMFHRNSFFVAHASLLF